MPRGVRNTEKEAPKAVEAVSHENTVAEKPVANTTPSETELLKQQNEMLARQLAEMQKQIAEMQKGAGATVVMAAPEEQVELTYIASVSPNNVLSLGDYGTLNGVGGCFNVPHKDFAGKFMTPEVRGLLNQRRLIVLNGLTEDERKRYNVDYKDGELLDMQMFDRLLDMPLPRVKEIFEKLCVEHKQIVATRFISAYQRGDNRISREKVEALNDLSKAVEPKGMFRPILEQMNKL